jgi:2-polyprenyl-3-methyl-5-hydroxy-6-metoxy-1,4-benzoquinol methylase
LVAISSYGEKNLEVLKGIIQTYRSMTMEVDVVVVSEAPKDLGSEVQVVVGLPARNPRSLPFAHKRIFAENVDRYDLFVFSEDDIGVTEKNIQAFVRATAHLKSDEIAGFLRYEVDQSGRWMITEGWGPYHWKPETVRRRGPYTIAEFTNEHAGFYALTQPQVRSAIASGGFLRNPCEGRYGMLETAATDPYTNCGFRKVICISDLEDFLVHHMSNRYANTLPSSLTSFQEQAQTLMDIHIGVHPSTTLCEVESKLWPWGWQKSYYERPSDGVLKMVPSTATNVLSIGCGWGVTEEILKERGAKVTALPLNSVIGAAAARRGINVIYGTLAECFRILDGQQFDCVLLTNLLHLQPTPAHLVERCSRFVQEGGALVLSGLNFDRVSSFIKRQCGIGESRKLWTYERSGISTCGPRTLAKCIRDTGLRISSVQWLNHTINKGPLRGKLMPLGVLTARNWVLQAQRPPRH